MSSAKLAIILLRPQCVSSFDVIVTYVDYYSCLDMLYKLYNCILLLTYVLILFSAWQVAPALGRRNK